MTPLSFFFWVVAGSLGLVVGFFVAAIVGTVAMAIFLKAVERWNL